MGLPLLGALTGQDICFDKTGYVDDVAGNAVGLLTAAAEQALAKYEEQVARTTAVPDDDDDADGALSEPEGESEEDMWAGAGLDEEEQTVQVSPESCVPPAPAHPPAQNVVSNVRHSVSVEAQAKALQEESAADNDYIYRSMRELRMRQHEGKMENVLCVVGKGARAVSAHLTQQGRSRAT